ncbi:hypothetical protein V1504DRAFT_468995 [Lipomyces starkeyi]
MATNTAWHVIQGNITPHPDKVTKHNTCVLTDSVIDHRRSEHPSYTSAPSCEIPENESYEAADITIYHVNLRDLETLNDSFQARAMTFVSLASYVRPVSHSLVVSHATEKCDRLLLASLDPRQLRPSGRRRNDVIMLSAQNASRDRCLRRVAGSLLLKIHLTVTSLCQTVLSNHYPTSSATTLADTIPFAAPASKTDVRFASPDTSYLTDKECDAGKSECVKRKIMGMRPRAAGLLFLSLIIILALGLGLGLGLGRHHNSNDSSNSNSESAPAIQSGHPRNWMNGKRNFHVTERNWTNLKRNWHIDGQTCSIFAC